MDFKILNLVYLILINKCIQSVHALCGYESCPKTKPGYINVHLVAHSHDDVGWLKTVDQYYLGTRLDIGPEAVQYILDSVITELPKNPSRKFIYVESGFFWRWWRSQTPETKLIVKSLINSGQLEFVSGGWSMSDEGSTHYNAIIDQMSLGLRYLNDTFGSCAVPKVGWQIDTFGHSRENANIFSQLGFQGLFLGRVDFKDKWTRIDKEEMEMLWATSPNNLGIEASLFTGILYNYYMPPTGFCYDSMCKDSPINDDPELDDYNVDKIVKKFLQVAKWWSQPYTTGHTLMTMGADFHYMNSNMWFKNLDKLIKYVNEYDYSNSTAKKVNVFYSTPSCYLQEVHKANKSLPVKTEDFFPYSNDYNGFWSGYFTSRPTFKYYIRQGNNILQACKQLGLASGKPTKETIDKIFKLAEPLAVVQHHDAITGTAKQHVTDDYSKRIAIGFKSCDNLFDSSFKNLLNQSGSIHSYKFCHQTANISACGASEELNDFILSVYNPRAVDLKNEYFRIPVKSKFWKVVGENGHIMSQVVPIPSPVGTIPGRVSKAKYEIVFEADLEALSLTSFRLSNENVSHFSTNDQDTSTMKEISEEIRIKNRKGLEITLNGTTGLLKSIKRGNVEVAMKQNFYYYLGMAGNNSEFKWRASGAYIFRPNTSDENGNEPMAFVEKVESFKVYEGRHVTEVHQIFNEWVSQVIRLYEEGDAVEFEWLVGPIPIEDGYGKEILTRYSTNLNTTGNFFTDSNGRQLIRRQRDKRDYEFDEYEKVAQNYYPVNSHMIITEEENLPLNKGPIIAILNDRSQGGTSMNDGEIELLVHRRLLYDDDFGVGEALNETAYGEGLIARGKHWLLLAGEGTGVPVAKHREMSQSIFMGKIMGFSEASLFGQLTLKSVAMAGSGLKEILPENIHLLTLEPLNPSQILLRLEHFYERGEDPVNSKSVKISINDLKKALPNVKFVRETTLGGNQWVEDFKRWDWHLKNNTSFNFINDESSVNSYDEIVLKPMEIKTFVLDVV